MFRTLLASSFVATIAHAPAAIAADPAIPSVVDVPAEIFDVPPVRRAAPPTPLRTGDRIGGRRVPERTLDPVAPGLLELRRMERLLPSSGPRSIGLVRQVAGAPLTLTGAARRTELENGRAAWSLAVRSPGAKRLRLRLEVLDLDGAGLTVSADRPAGTVVHGPWHDRGPEGGGGLWTASVPGEVIHLEVVGPADAAPDFVVTEVAHFDVHPFEAVADGGDNGSDVFDCHLDAACASALPEAAVKATGQMSFVSGGEVKVCTGTMLGDLDPHTAVPNFITAAHCVNSQTEVNSLEVVWNWERVACNGNLPDYDTLPVNRGGKLLVTYAENDMTFIRLDDGMLASATAGFTTTRPDEGVGVHHPSGSFKRGVWLEDVGVCPGCLCLDGDDFDYYEMTIGLVEGGSSGSGVFNMSGQFAGQLYGRCSDFSDPDDMNCSNIDDYWAVYGEFESTWEDTPVQYWLQLGGTIQVSPVGNPLCENGLAGCPFDTIAEAEAFAWDGTRLVIAAGSYDEAITIDEQIELVPLGGTVTIGQ